MDTLNMNIDTLLEAAIFLEKRNTSPGEGSTNAKARAKSASFNPYPKLESNLTSDKNGDEQSTDTGTETETSPMDEGKDRRRAGGAGTREVHNKLEKNRRAHLKECFELLKKQIPSLEDKRTSNLAILRCSLRYIQMLKRKEKEFEQEMLQLAKDKIRAQERIGNLKRDLAAMNIDVDINSIVANAVKDEDTASDSTATADNESPIVSDVEDDDEADTASTMQGALIRMETQDSEPQHQHTQTQQQQQSQSNDRKPHVPVTATLPAIQPPVPTLAPKRLAVNATTPIVLAPFDQTQSHTVLAMPSAKILANATKMMAAANQPIMAVPTGTTTVSITPAMMAGLTSFPPTQPAASLAPGTPRPASPACSTPTSTQAPATPTTATFRTPVAQILQQTISQRVLAQQLQQARLQHPPQLQQVQLHQIPAQLPQQNQSHMQQGMAQQAQAQQQTNQLPKGFAVHANSIRNAKSLTQLRQGMTINQLVPTLYTPGTSILATPGTMTSTQLGALATMGKVQMGTTAGTSIASSATGMSTISLATSSASGTVCSTPTAQPSVTFTTMKQFLTPSPASPQTPQLATHAVMSLSGTQMSALTQLMAQQHQVTPQSPRAGTTVQPQQQQAAAVVAAATTTVNMAGIAHMTNVTAPTAATGYAHVAPNGQMVAPLSMVSPAGVQMAHGSGGISPAHLSLVNSPLLRSLGHIPIQLQHQLQHQLQQPFGLGQLVKPVVMAVSMPNVVVTQPSPSTSAPPPAPTVSAVQLQLPVSHAS